MRDNGALARMATGVRIRAIELLEGLIEDMAGQPIVQLNSKIERLEAALPQAESLV